MIYRLKLFVFAIFLITGLLVHFIKQWIECPRVANIPE